jgi:hypothetical protein
MRDWRARHRAADPSGYLKKQRATRLNWRARHAERYREYQKLLMRIQRARAKMAKLLGREMPKNSKE